MPLIALHDFRTNIAELVDAGCHTTPEYDRIAARFDAFLNPDTDPVDDLGGAIIGTADSDRLAQLTASAMTAMAAPTARMPLATRVAVDVLRALRAEYATVAEENYNVLAAAFNKVAAKVTAAHRLVDVDANPAALLTAEDRARKAWMEAELLAGELDTLVPALTRAAAMAGARLNAPEPERGLSVVADVAGLHRRRVWEAWEASEGRTGRWGALIALGAEIGAQPLEAIQPYAQPRPMETRQERHGIGIRQVPFDPEDAVEVVAVDEAAQALAPHTA